MVVSVAVRLAGVVLILIGLIATLVGIMNGCSSLFTWDGRHPVRSVNLVEGRTTETLIPEPGRRYVLSVEVVFSREGLERRDGVTVVEAKLPLVVRVKDRAGTSLVETVGWIDPAEPPNVLYGQAAQRGERENGGRARTELVVIRLVGPFIASSDGPLSIDVDVGPDRLGKAKIALRRLVIHDDALPSAVRNALVIAAAGGVAILTGASLVVIRWLRTRRTTPRPKGKGPPEGQPDAPGIQKT